MDDSCQETSFTFNVHMVKDLRSMSTLTKSLLPLFKAYRTYTVIFKRSLDQVQLILLLYDKYSK